MPVPVVGALAARFVEPGQMETFEPAFATVGSGVTVTVNVRCSVLLFDAPSFTVTVIMDVPALFEGVYKIVPVGFGLV